ncbi:Pycsar system effector family protein [Carboxylicivirga sp. M1479]|uniref:Pycsar system effector family protein n=2 Tax=Carboxylicivirga TaxID=1628153 RepID=UPI001C8F69D8|nr:Pycsar system effector family protein [Carboxylicivirga sp. M1479]
MMDIVNTCLNIVKDKIDKNKQSDLFYHNWEHINNVLINASEIANATPEVGDDELEQIQLAAIFHDSCFHCNRKEHETESACYAEELLKSEGYEKAKLETVKRLILATQHNHQPSDLLEQIIIDADLSHLQSNKYLKQAFTNLYYEQKAMRELSPQQWVQECIEFLNQHQYYTEYALKNFTKGKLKNIKRLEELAKRDIVKLEDAIDSLKKDKKDKEKNQKSKSTTEKPDKGIETLFRVTLPNHISLSQIADNKANTIISVNAIIISIVLSTLFPNFAAYQGLFIPASVLLFLCVITIILAMVSTIPRTTHGIMTREDVKNKKGNLAFFGNFHRMSQDDFEWGMEEVLKDKSYLYKSLTRDLFFLGKVLNKKYIYLRIAYIAFVLNLIVSITLFVIFLKAGM